MELMRKLLCSNDGIKQKNKFSYKKQEGKNPDMTILIEKEYFYGSCWEYESFSVNSYQAVGLL